MASRKPTSSARSEGWLIDKRSRKIVSEVASGVDTLTPSYELLRIEPGSEHEHAGEWVYRDREGGVFLQSGAEVEVDAAQVRAAAVSAQNLTFARAPGDARLRAGMRFDWDSNGYVSAGPTKWVSWAGHCDVKAVLEQLGITLTENPRPTVEEYRSDTGQSRFYGRDLLLEMLASSLELGSQYSRIDGTGRLIRGQHEFGGARNDSLPDRLQFQGEGTGRSFRWPLGRGKSSFVVTGIRGNDGSAAELGTVFFRNLPDTEQTRFSPNPRYIKTVEGDYNLIDVSESVVEAQLLLDVVDPVTGYISTAEANTSIDLRPGAQGDADGMFLLGTHVDDAAGRRIFKVYWDPKANEIVANLFVHTRVADRWVEQALPGESVRLPMVRPLSVTLSREMRRDNPEQFQALLAIAHREAKNICADTDKEAPVWNGVVTKITSEKVASNRELRTEHWRYDFVARFGQARLEYLVRRDTAGVPVEYCPAVGEDAPQKWPDFLWHDVPDVGSKAFVQGEWVVNTTMVDRGIITTESDDSVGGGAYVHDDHVKNVFELLYCAFADYRYTIVHNNQRYGFERRSQWEVAVDKFEELRSAVRYEE